MGSKQQPLNQAQPVVNGRAGKGSFSALLEHGLTGGQIPRMWVSVLVSVHDGLLGATKLDDAVTHPGKLSPRSTGDIRRDIYNPKELGQYYLGRNDLADLTEFGKTEDG